MQSAHWVSCLAKLKSNVSAKIWVGYRAISAVVIGPGVHIVCRKMVLG